MQYLCIMEQCSIIHMYWEVRNSNVYTEALWARTYWMPQYGTALPILRHSEQVRTECPSMEQHCLY